MPSLPRAGAAFPATRVSMIASLASEQAEVRRGGFESLVEGYWRASYKYVRVKWRTTPEEAADLTQGFFLRAFEKQYFAAFDPAKARFRTFLRVCLDRFVARERQDRSRLKRGGAIVFVPLDFEGAERELAAGAAVEDVDEFFRREWMRTVFALAVDRLKAHCTTAGRAPRFALFEHYDLAPDEASRPTYAALARQARITPAQVTNELAAARRDFRRFVVDVLRQQCASDEEFENEVRAWKLR